MNDPATRDHGPTTDQPTEDPAYDEDVPHPAETVTDDDQRPEEQPTMTAKLVAFMEERNRVGQSTDGELFYVPRQGPNVTQRLEDDRRLREKITGAYFSANGTAPGSHAIHSALAVLRERARCQPAEPVAVRVARHDDQIVLDLGGSDGQAVVISADGWRVTSQPPVLFRRSMLTKVLPEPRRGSLDPLWELLPIPTHDQPLVAAWLVTALMGDVACPILTFLAEHGAAKTTAGRLLADLIDSRHSLRAQPTSQRDWTATAHASHVMGIDNVTGQPPAWLTDTLCRTTTGDAIATRALYTNNDVVGVSYRRPIIITSIGLGQIRGDLADRLLTIELPAIPDQQRRREADIWDHWNAIHPEVLGGLCDLAARVLATLTTVELPGLPRMADYAETVAAIDQLWGTQALERYLGKRTRLASETTLDDPVAAAIVAYIDTHGSLEGTASDLRDQLRPNQPSERRHWPATAADMGRHLTHLKPGLRELGLKVDNQRTARARRWTITRPTTNDTPSSPSHPSST